MWMKRIWWESWGSAIVRSDILSRINPVAMAVSIPEIPNFWFLALQPSSRTHKKDHHHPPNLMTDPRVFSMLTCPRSSVSPPVIVSAWGRACCLVLWISVLQSMLMTGRGAPIQYSGSVSLWYWPFLLDRGIGLTRPIQIRYSTSLILCYCYGPTKATNTL